MILIEVRESYIGVNIMKLGHDLILTQQQKLVLTPELRQAIELLQFTTQELKEYIDNELQENPLLEREKEEQEFESLDDEINWKEYIEKNRDNVYTGEYTEREQKDYDFTNFVSYNPQLRETLFLQLNVLDINKKELEVGHFIIENIDDSGYLEISTDNISKDLDVDIDLVENILKKIQTFEPTGVGARDLRESLIIQLKELNIEDGNVYTVVNNHLNDLGGNKLRKISQELDMSLEDTQEVCDIIRNLNPKPGQKFATEDRVKYITPDAYIRKIDDEYIVILNDSTAPRLNINNFYKKMLTQEKDKNATEYLSERLDSAMWIIKTIEQRRTTILKVLNAILKFQLEFFENGEKFLKPLTLREIAEEIDMHESTVSRTTNAKYVQTDQGLFEFKYFFSSSLSTSEGEISSTSIKAYIEDIIDKEDKKKPLSDQKIADMLKEKGVEISRRTVAKYRDEMEILSSTRRRRY